MIRFIFFRLLSSIPLLLLLSVLVFFSIRLAPGGPFDTERVFPPEIQEAILKQYHLDQPVLTQYFLWLKDVLRGNLHESFQYLGKPVLEILREGFPTSFKIGVLALIFSLFFGIPLGALAASKKGSLSDFLAMTFSITGVSLPSYLVASLLVLVFALKLNWFPPALWESPTSWVLPTLTLGLRPLALIARLIRSSVIEALQSDYIRTARSKGLSETKIIFKHAVRNSLLPVLSLLGPLAASLVTGSFLVEIVFQIPGIGKYFVSAVINRDYPLVMGVTLFYGAILVLTNLMIDILYAWADPRIRFEEK